MATYASLVTKLRDRLDEATARKWSDEMLIRWLYDGAKDVGRKTECLQTTADLNISAGDQQVTLPVDIVRLHRVEWRPDGDTRVIVVRYRDYNTMDAVWWSGQLQATSEPAICTMWGSPPDLALVLYPLPSTAGIARVFYYKLPTDPGGDDTATVELPNGWEDLAVDYAEWYSLRRDSDQRWQEAQAMYQEHMMDLAVTAQRWTDQAGLVVPSTGGYGVPEWLWNPDYAG